MGSELTDDQRSQGQEGTPRLRDLITVGLESGEGRPVTEQLIEDLRTRSFSDESPPRDDGCRALGGTGQDLPGRVGYGPWAMAPRIWSASELEKLPPAEQDAIFAAAIVRDLGAVPPEFLERVRSRLRDHIGGTEPPAV